MQPSFEGILPSTMLDFAMKPEEAFRAPLNTTKLAPVTVRHINEHRVYNLFIIKSKNYTKTLISYTTITTTSMTNG